MLFSKPVRTTKRTLLGAMLPSLFVGLCVLSPGHGWCQLQSGRDSAGNLWLSDQSLPAGIQPGPLELDQVMSLTPETRPVNSSSPAAPPERSPVTQQRMTADESATCRSIDKRYEETRINLANIERDKASGKVLIPNSGLVTIRQNLASLERLKSLCPKSP